MLQIRFSTQPFRVHVQQQLTHPLRQTLPAQLLLSLLAASVLLTEPPAKLPERHDKPSIEHVMSK